LLEQAHTFRAAIGEGKGNPEGLLFGISKEEVVAGSFHDAIDRWVRTKKVASGRELLG